MSSKCQLQKLRRTEVTGSYEPEAASRALNLTEKFVPKGASHYSKEIEDCEQVIPPKEVIHI
jgi:hypothetical protein